MEKVLKMSFSSSQTRVCDIIALTVVVAVGEARAYKYQPIKIYLKREKSVARNSWRLFARDGRLPSNKIFAEYSFGCHSGLARTQRELLFSWIPKSLLCSQYPSSLRERLPLTNLFRFELNSRKWYNVKFYCKNVRSAAATWWISF